MPAAVRICRSRIHAVLLVIIGFGLAGDPDASVAAAPTGSRPLRIEDLGRSLHHGVNEVWSSDHAKWVLFDAKYDVHFERDGVPQSELELHEAVRVDGGRGIGRCQHPRGSEP